MEIDETPPPTPVISDVLCNKLYQFHMPEDEMKNFVIRKNWRPLLEDADTDCGLNVLSFLDILPKKSARGKATCVNVDAGFSMTDIKDLIVQNKKITYAMNINKIAFNPENLAKFVFNQLENESLTLVRAYISNKEKMGNTMIFYKLGLHLHLFVPQKGVYTEIWYDPDSKRFLFHKNGFLPSLTDNPNYKRLQEKMNKYVSFEFLTVNENLQVIAPIEKTPVFEPLILTEENPFHMFLVVAHGATVYNDNYKESLEFPFHSLGFFVEKGVMLQLFATPTSTNVFKNILQNITGAMKGNISNTYGYDEDPLGIGVILTSTAKTSDVIVNTDGKIDVYPMYWTTAIDDPPKMKNAFGLYHLIYDKRLGTFRSLNKIVGYEFFTDETTGLPKQIYYGHIIRKFNKYYKENRGTYFKNIPRELIFMGIWSCRYQDTRLSTPQSQGTEDASKMEFVEDEPYNPNISKLKDYLQVITKRGGNRTESNPESTKNNGPIEMVSQDELFKILQKQQKEREIIAESSPPKPVFRRQRRKTFTSRKARKTRKTKKRKSFLGF